MYKISCYFDEEVNEIKGRKIDVNKWQKREEDEDEIGENSMSNEKHDPARTPPKLSS